VAKRVAYFLTIKFKLSKGLFDLDRIQFELPRRRFGVKSHEDSGVLFRWSGHWSSPET